jgi:hypothetical protein
MIYPKGRLKLTILMNFKSNGSITFFWQPIDTNKLQKLNNSPSRVKYNTKTSSTLLELIILFLLDL